MLYWTNIKILPCLKPDPEPKQPVDLSKLAIMINPVTGDILDSATRQSTGKNFKECAEIIQNTKNDLEINSKGKLVGSCENSSSCDACVEAINSSVLDFKKVKTYFSVHQYQRVLLILYQSDEVCTLSVHTFTLWLIF